MCPLLAEGCSVQVDGDKNAVLVHDVELQLWTCTSYVLSA